MAISSIALFDGLTVVEQARLLGRMDKVHYEEKSTIFKQGEQGECMYIISTGKVEVYIHPAGH